MPLVTSFQSFPKGTSGTVYGAQLAVDGWKAEAAKHLHVHAYTRSYLDTEMSCFQCQAIVIPNVDDFLEALKELPREHFDKINALCGLTEKVE